MKYTFEVSREDGAVQYAPEFELTIKADDDEEARRRLLKIFLAKDYKFKIISVTP